MANRIYVGNIPFSTTEEDIRSFFSGYRLTDIKIVIDRETGRARGFGFVEVETSADMHEAIDQLHEQKMGGRTIVVREAISKKPERGAPRGPRNDRGRENRDRPNGKKGNSEYGWS